MTGQAGTKELVLTGDSEGSAGLWKARALPGPLLPNEFEPQGEKSGGAGIAEEVPGPAWKRVARLGTIPGNRSLRRLLLKGRVATETLHDAARMQWTDVASVPELQTSRRPDPSGKDRREYVTLGLALEPNREWLVERPAAIGAC